MTRGALCSGVWTALYRSSRHRRLHDSPSLARTDSPFPEYENVQPNPLTWTNEMCLFVGV